MEGTKTVSFINHRIKSKNHLIEHEGLEKESYGGVLLLIIISSIPENISKEESKNVIQENERMLRFREGRNGYLSVGLDYTRELFNKFLSARAI